MDVVEAFRRFGTRGGSVGLVGETEREGRGDGSICLVGEAIRLVRCPLVNAWERVMRSGNLGAISGGSSGLSTHSSRPFAIARASDRVLGSGWGLDAGVVTAGFGVGAADCSF